MIGGRRTDRMVIGGRRKHLLFLKKPCNLFRAFSFKAKTVNSSHYLGSRLINKPLFFIKFVTLVTVWYTEVTPFAVRCLHRPHSAHLLAGLRRIPLVENVVKGHHLRTLAGFGVHTLLNGDEFHA